MKINVLINKSELAREIGLTPSLFRKKLKNINYNKFSEIEIKKIKSILQKLANELK